ncbi:MAG: hypothetical protein K0S34_1014 [Bacillales bacterium]|jgi:hypothetical protein|nr:hypothetical protein [Bacillales bacterium]
MFITSSAINLNKGVRKIYTNQDYTLWINVSNRKIKLIDTDNEVELGAINL